MFSVLLTRINKRSIYLIPVTNNGISQAIEVAGNGETEGNDFIMSAFIQNDSTIYVTQKFCYQNDEQYSEVEPESCDSIATIYRISRTGLIVQQVSDTMPSNFVTVPELMDDEYVDVNITYDENSPTSWKTATISDPVAFKNFFMDFRTMVKLDNKDEIANHIQFPIDTIKDETAFILNYDKLFSKEIKSAVLNQKTREMYRDSRGVMIGNNDMWFKEFNGVYKIVMIKRY